MNSCEVDLLEVTPEATPSDPPPANSDRCQFHSMIGHRCRMPRSPQHRLFCGAHSKMEQQRLAEPHYDHEAIGRALTPHSGNFRTATDVNQAIGQLFLLLAQGQIARREAVALGYLAQLLLQTLPNVTREFKHVLGIHAWEEAVQSALGAEEEPDDPDEATSNADDADDADEAIGSDAEPDEASNGGPDGACEEVGTREAPDAGAASEPSSEARHPAQAQAKEVERVVLALEEAEPAEALERAEIVEAPKRAGPDESLDKVETVEAAEEAEPAEAVNEAKPITAPSEPAPAQAPVARRPVRAIFRSPGLIPGTEQAIEVILPEDWGRH